VEQPRSRTPGIIVGTAMEFAAAAQAAETARDGADGS
jgi:hypothetical protein